jgi:hypothetical protein
VNIDAHATEELVKAADTREKMSEGKAPRKTEPQVSKKVVDAPSTILNRLIELSVVSVEATTPVFAVLPVRPFRSTFGFDVRALTALTDQTGVMSLLDVEGHVIADTTLNATLVERTNSTMPAYAPEYIVRPSHLSDQMFGVIS